MDEQAKLQKHVSEGADATALLTGKFTDGWLEGVKEETLGKLSSAKPDELINVQADYNAAMRFYNMLTSVARKGEQAAQKLRSAEE